MNTDKNGPVRSNTNKMQMAMEIIIVNKIRRNMFLFFIILFVE
jgi:hypothetical protein